MNEVLPGLLESHLRTIFQLGSIAGKALGLDIIIGSVFVHLMLKGDEVGGSLSSDDASISTRHVLVPRRMKQGRKSFISRYIASIVCELHASTNASGPEAKMLMCSVVLVPRRSTATPSQRR